MKGDSCLRTSLLKDQCEQTAIEVEAHKRFHSIVWQRENGTALER